MREFVSKSKKVKITIAGTSHEMRCPNLGESEALEKDLKENGNANIMTTYKTFFGNLGLPIEAFDKMDTEDFLEFVKFVLNPKSEGPQATV